MNGPEKTWYLENKAVTGAKCFIAQAMEARERGV
jgi:hypothetical protein